MTSPDMDIIKNVLQYQERLERYNLNKNEDKILYVIGKLSKIPIKTLHLETTGIGRTVNALKKLGGDVAEAAKDLVLSWKEMVLEEEKATQEASIETEDDVDSVYSSENESKDCQKQNLTKENEITNSDNDENESEGYSSKKEVPNKSGGELDSKQKYSNKNSNKNNRRSSSTSDSSESEEETSSKHRKRSYSSDSSSEERPSSKRSCKEKDTSEDSHKHSHKSSKDIKKYEKKDKHSSSSHRESSDKHNGSSAKSEIKHKSRKESDDNSKRNHRKESEEDKTNKLKRESKNSHSSHRSDKRKKSNEKEHEETHTSKSDKHKKHDTKTDNGSKSSHSHKHKSNESSSHSSSGKKVDKEKDRKDKDKHEAKKEKKEVKSPEKNSKESSKEEKKLESNDLHSASSSKHKSSSNDKNKKKNKVNVEKTKSKEKIINGIGSESGASFAEALGMCGPSVSLPKKKSSSDKNRHSVNTDKSSNSESSKSKSKPKYEDDASGSSSSKLMVPELLKEEPPEPLNICLSSLLPEITPNYKPTNISIDMQPKRICTDDEALSRVMANKNQRTKVYSGNKTFGKVESLFQLCVRVLQDNIDALEYTGGVPYLILKSIMDKATPDQLFNLEHHNPYLIGDTDELWQLHCQKDFRTKRREEMESWRDMYMRCLDEREARLNVVKASIKQSIDKSIPVRTTKLAYIDSEFVKPPRNIARKQAKNGTINTDRKTTPTQKLSAIARSGEAEKTSVPDPGRRAAEKSSSSTSSSSIKPKKAPLMAKTLSFLKNRFKR